MFRRLLQPLNRFCMGCTIGHFGSLVPFRRNDIGQLRPDVPRVWFAGSRRKADHADKTLPNSLGRLLRGRIHIDVRALLELRRPEDCPHAPRNWCRSRRGSDRAS
jgi:hypothetical protein